MTTQTRKTSWFAPKLRAAIDSKDSSVRALARAWRPSSSELARRSLNRYLQNGIVPGPETRAELAEALGVAREMLEPDEEDEADQVLASDLGRALLELVRSTIKRGVTSA